MYRYDQYDHAMVQARVEDFRDQIPQALAQASEDPVDRLTTAFRACCLVVDAKRAAVNLTYRESKTLTPEGLDKLKAEIEHLSTEKRREVAERIKEAREFGDISENAEYDDAKNEQAMLEHKIAQLEERLVNARVISKRDIDLSVVSIGAKVKLRDVERKKTDEYFIVGSAEANPAENKLSNESPVGKAIMGKKKGEVVEVSAPRGSLKFKIMEIKAA